VVAPERDQGFAQGSENMVQHFIVDPEKEGDKNVAVIRDGDVFNPEGAKIATRRGDDLYDLDDKWVCRLGDGGPLSPAFRKLLEGKP
jgi:hypothetical protein